MKKIKAYSFFILVISLFLFLIYLIVEKGKGLETNMNHLAVSIHDNPLEIFTDTFKNNLTHPLAILLIQIVTIILVARVFGWLCNKIGQPTVIGEIIAGIVLGPSLLGYVSPEIFESLFPAQSLDNLQFLSQIGLILFMFVIGMEFDINILRRQAREAVVISNVSIIFPFALGILLSFFLYKSFAPQGIAFLSFALFIGISMSITAFPVLARIAQERGLHKTKLGSLVITCAAVGDISAWLILAVVIAIVKAGSFMSALPNIILVIAYLYIMIKIVKPLLKKVGESHSSRENLSKPIVAVFFTMLLLSSYLTEIIGVHALFGAFMAGTIMPENNKFKQVFIEKVEDVSLVLFLPLFFVYTGLNTQIGLLNDFYLWKVCILIVLVAITGKFAGSAIAAKAVGQSWRNSLTIGALMNTRGLIELVALNIGLDLGVITPEVFAMLVLMALITTFMTSPSLHLIQYFYTRKEKILLKGTSQKRFNILISFGKPEMGRALLRVAESLIKGRKRFSSVTAIHLTPNSSLLSHYKLDEYERESFTPVNDESRKLNISIKTKYKISDDIDNDIVDTANSGEFNLLLIGLGQSGFQGNILGNLLNNPTGYLNFKNLLSDWKDKKTTLSTRFAKVTRNILKYSNIPVGILVDNNLSKIRKILVPVIEGEDDFLIEYVLRFIGNSDINIDIVRVNEPDDTNSGFVERMEQIHRELPENVAFSEIPKPDPSFLASYDLVVLSVHFWRKLNLTNDNWLNDGPSKLIIKT